MAGELSPFKRLNRLAKREDGDPINALQRRMNRLLEDFHRNFELMPFDEREWMPKVNVSEGEGELRVTAELPGMDEKDVDVTLTRDTLRIKGEKKEEKEEKKENYHRVERAFGSFYREVQLPCEIETDKVDAKFKNGVLSITLPKCKEARQDVKKITVSGK